LALGLTCEHSSLFDPFLSNEEKSFTTLTLLCIKLLLKLSLSLKRIKNSLEIKIIEFFSKKLKF
jgi:hypothetical protein